MMSVLAPEGRYLITKGENENLQPVTLRRGFAPDWVGRPLADFEAET